MSINSIQFQNVSFRYEASLVQVVQGLSVHFSTGWTGIVGANGSGKTTILKLASGDLVPQEGQVLRLGRAVFCQQRTDNPPEQTDDFRRAYDSTALKIQSRLGIHDDWFERWSTLSHGERKRIQIAVALWQEPEILLLDEPTNHLDTDTKNVLFDTLRIYQGTGILVSHDREFLDELCVQCLFVEPGEAVMRPGGYSEGVKLNVQERESALKEREKAVHEYQNLTKEHNRRKSLANSADKKRSKRNLAVRDHDAKAKIDLARVTGKDGSAGRKLRQMEGRFAQSRARLQDTNVPGVRELGITLPGQLSHRNYLFSLPAGTLVLSQTAALQYPQIMMNPDDRIALTGPNGSGKSTLIRHLLSGINLSGDDIVYVPQEITTQYATKLLQDVKALSHDKMGLMFTIVSRLGSEPKHLLDTREPSPGEVRKLLLAYGIIHTPKLIIMDEPTNHMDIPSIQCLEEALQHTQCGMLLVSHDRLFLDSTTQLNWRIVASSYAPDNYELTIQ